MKLTVAVVLSESVQADEIVKKIMTALLLTILKLGQCEVICRGVKLLDGVH